MSDIFCQLVFSVLTETWPDFRLEKDLEIRFHRLLGALLSRDKGQSPERQDNPG